MNSERLRKFRQAAYELLVVAKDATFELMDAVMTTRNASCLAEFSLSPLFNRQWSSIYEALQDCRPDRKKLMELYREQLEQQIPATEHILVAIDHTAWGRPEAKTLKDRTHEYHKGVIIGQGYSTIAWIPEAQGSWALPLLHERISSGSSPILQAASQLKLVCEQSLHPVLAVLDREYGNANWVLAQADIQADCLMRVRKNACLWSAPPAYSGRGRPRKHGPKMRLNDPTTWLQADAAIEIDEHPQLGQVQVRQWVDLHFYRAPEQRVNLIQIERMKPMSNGQPFPPLWLAWVGERTLPLETVWFKYLRRFGVDHWYRFAKQRLHWTLPNLRTPEQSERWSDLMPLMSWQLWLARDLVIENVLPWQSATINLTPGRVAQSMLSVLVDIGTPAKMPKQRGKSPGWEKGRIRTKAPCYPTVKKRVSRRKKSSKLVV
ncbi:NF041680 family putative transposase [Microcoleus sp. w2-18bC1]|uniref:NF041680 family putative transposase n=1 Tax=unclassified Microcoleus TaxID=2642155 RepID=UPI002FD62D84